jgi:hypothetical protein
MATRTQNVLGERGRRIRELTALVQKRFGFAPGQVELYAEKVSSRGLCAVAQCESLRYKLVGGLAVRRACYGVLRFIMESEARGCEIVVSGKIRGQRAKAMKVCLFFALERDVEGKWVYLAFSSGKSKGNNDSTISKKKTSKCIRNRKKLEQYIIGTLPPLKICIYKNSSSMA